MENLKIAREALMEAVAETSEEYMDRYFAGEEFTQDEILGEHVILLPQLVSFPA